MTIQGGGSGSDFSVITVAAGTTATLENLTISDGYTSGNGGGICNSGTVTVTNSTISGNSGDGISNGGGSDYGGGGTLTVTNSTISGNFGGGISNGGGSWYGAGGTVTVTNSTISGNTGGGISNGGGNGAGGGGTLTVTNSTISGNTGDGISNGGGNWDFGDGGTVTVTNSTISENTGDGISNGGANPGGYSAGTVTVTNSTIAGNTGDGISDGGGSWIVGYASAYGGTAMVTNSTIAGNTGDGISNGGGNGDNGDGGTATVTNSTIAGNTGDGISNGSGSDYGGGGTATVTNSTIAGNFGYGISNGGDTTNLENTIVASNGLTNSDCDLSGDFNLAFSLIQNVNGFSFTETVPGSNLSGVDPLLGLLQNNGGPTETMALLPGSPAIGAGEIVDGITTDQRGELRADPPDIGAYQYNVPGNQASTTTTLTTLPNPTVFGQWVLLTVTVNPVSPGSGTPSGLVTFRDDGTALTTPLGNGGQAIFGFVNGLVGTQTFSASYSGDTNFSSSSSASVLQTINQAGTTTTVAAPLTSSVYGQSVTFTATVTVNGPGSGTVTSGTVTFFDNGGPLGAPQVLSGTNNTATLTTSSLSVGLQTITASYSGDGVDFAASAPSAAVQQTVVQANTTTTVTTPTGQDNPSAFGESVTFTAAVSANGSSAGTVTSGTVTFFDNGSQLGAPQVLSGTNNTATLTTSSLSVGLQTITASYSGDGVDFAASATSAAVQQTVVQANTTTTVTTPTGQDNPSAFGRVGDVHGDGDRERAGFGSGNQRHGDVL